MRASCYRHERLGSGGDRGTDCTGVSEEAGLHNENLWQWPLVSRLSDALVRYRLREDRGGRAIYLQIEQTAQT